jgi:glycosyltransferase involved in cell wall biosynthesis
VRVLHLINGEHYAGAERVQDLLALRLFELGFEVAFACLKPGKFAERRQARRATLYNVPMRRKWDLRPVRSLARLMRDEGFALLHTHTTRTGLIGRLASAWAGVPMVHHVHSQTATEVGRVWDCRVNAWTERLVLAGAAAVVTVSPSARAYAMRQRIPERIVRLVPNGIPSRGVLPMRRTPRSRWTLGTVALFRPRKGLEILLRAVALLRAQGIDVRLRAVGPFETDAYRGEVRALAARLGLEDAIDWTGFSADINAELDRMDLFVFPSIVAEGMPMVLLEAMAAGVPIVASAVDGVTELVSHGRTGLLAPPGSAAALAATIRQAVQGEVDCMPLRMGAYRRQAAEFSDHSMAAGVAAVYREVLQT